MNITVSQESKIKKLSLDKNISFANMLRGYMVDDLMWRIYTSEYKEFLWLLNKDAVGSTAYQTNREDTLRFLYKKSDKKLYGEEILPGQELSLSLLESLLHKEIESENSAGVSWRGQVRQEATYFLINLTGRYEEMEVPVRLRIGNVEDPNAFPQKEALELVCNRYPVTLYTYSVENALCKALHEIFYKLELIGDMEAYYLVDTAVKTQAISGRRVVEQLEELHPMDQKFYVEKRLQQIEGYKNYAYMRKRWEQYGKKNGLKLDPWELVIGRFLKFMGPIWTAMCKQEVFFDDWMPELERYLG